MMDATQIDPDLGTRIQTCILIDAVASKLSICRRAMGREHKARETGRNSPDDGSQKSTRRLKYDE